MQTGSLVAGLPLEEQVRIATARLRDLRAGASETVERWEESADKARDEVRAALEGAQNRTSAFGTPAVAAAVKDFTANHGTALASTAGGNLAGTVSTGHGWILRVGLAVLQTAETNDKVTGATGSLRLISDAQAASTAYIRKEVRESGALNRRIAHCLGNYHRLLVAENSQAQQQLEDLEELLDPEHVGTRTRPMDEWRRRVIDQVRKSVDGEADIRTGIESAIRSPAESGPKIESVTRDEFARFKLLYLKYKSTPSGLLSPGVAPPFMHLVGKLVRERKDGTVWARMSLDTWQGRASARSTSTRH